MNVENTALRTVMRAGIRIGTAAEFLRHHHSLFAYCQHCRRWASVDLDALVQRGLGDVLVRALPLRCRECGTRAELQVRPPVPSFRGYSS